MGAVMTADTVVAMTEGEDEGGHGLQIRQDHPAFFPHSRAPRAYEGYLPTRGEER